MVHLKLLPTSNRINSWSSNSPKKPGLLERFYETQVERGFDAVRPVIDRVIGYFSTVSGPADQVIHLYAFDSLDDWQTRLHGLYGVPELEPYFLNVRPLMYGIGATSTSPFSTII